MWQDKVIRLYFKFSNLYVSKFLKFFEIGIITNGRVYRIIIKKRMKQKNKAKVDHIAERLCQLIYYKENEKVHFIVLK